MKGIRAVLFVVAMFLSLVFVAYAVDATQNPAADSMGQKMGEIKGMMMDSSAQKGEMKMQITSTAFKEGDTIPVQYTCDGADISPLLEFSDVPSGTKSLALIADDPDAPMGIWVHWVIYAIPPEMKGLHENILKVVSPIAVVDKKEVALMQGENSSKDYGYHGPCPPSGVHRYYFKLYALDFMLKFSKEEVVKGVNKEMVLDRIKGHVLAEASLMGRYSRKK